MEESESEIRKKLEKSRNKILENSRKMNEELDRLRLEEVKKVAREIVSVFPGEVSKETFEQIIAIVAKYQKKYENAIQKFLDMDRQKQIIELSNISIDDESYWPKIIAAKELGIPVPEIEESMKLPSEKKRTKLTEQVK